MQIVNEYINISYNMQKLSIILINNFEVQKDNRYQFYAINIQNYNIILELS